MGSLYDPTTEQNVFTIGSPGLPCGPRFCTDFEGDYKCREGYCKPLDFIPIGEVTILAILYYSILKLNYKYFLNLSRVAYHSRYIHKPFIFFRGGSNRPTSELDHSSLS